MSQNWKKPSYPKPTYKKTQKPTWQSQPNIHRPRPNTQIKDGKRMISQRIQRHKNMITSQCMSPKLMRRNRSIHGFRIHTLTELVDRP